MRNTLFPLLARAAVPLYYRRVKRFLADARRARAIQRRVVVGQGSQACRERIRPRPRFLLHPFGGRLSPPGARCRLRLLPPVHRACETWRTWRNVRARDERLDVRPDVGDHQRSRNSSPSPASSSTNIAAAGSSGRKELLRSHRPGTQRTLQLTSDWKQFYTEGGIPCGNISGLAAESAPAILHYAYATPLPVTKILNPAAKHYTTLRLAMAYPRVGIIITANPSTLLELARAADAHRESLVRDIFDGTLSRNVDVSAPVREALRPWTVRRNPDRARQLEQIIRRTGTLYPKDFWASLSLLAIWLGGSANVYLPRLKQYYGDTVLRDHGLSASEGRMTIPLADGSSSGVLEFVNHYFEFIPEEERDADRPVVLQAHELEAGRCYFILLTTSGGLYRYDIHDVVRCVGYEGEAPVLEFLNKGTHYSSTTGEKLSEFQVVAAVKKGFAELGLPLEHFTLAPVMQERPNYVLLVEADACGGNAQQLAERIEMHLCQMNCEYAEKVRTSRLKPLVVQEITSGTWRLFRQQRIAVRGNLEEYKHPCLVNDLQFIDQVGKLSAAASAGAKETR